MQRSRIGRLREGTVLEFLADGSSHQHEFLPVEGSTLRLRGGQVTVTIYDKDGNIIPPPPPQPSEPQALVQAARTDERLEKALHHWCRSDSWFDIYMAVEALFKAKDSNRLLPMSLRKRRDVAH
jgi:hypothetical protein